LDEEAVFRRAPHVPGCAPPDLIYMAARAGYDAVSLRTIPMRFPNGPSFELSKNKQLLKQAKVDSHGTARLVRKPPPGGNEGSTGGEVECLEA
jgi:hypothetical protein